VTARRIAEKRVKGSRRSTPKVALTGVAFRPRLVRLVRPFRQVLFRFLSGIDRLGMAELPRTTHPQGVAW
jgi:hypothetical protein